MKPGQAIRAFLEQLLTSRHVRFLEAELIRVRMEKDAYIRTLCDEKATLQAKIDKLELAIWPLASRAGAVYAAKPHTHTAQEVKMPATTYAQAVQEHIEKIQQEEEKLNA